MMTKRLASAELQSGSLLAAERPHQASGAKKNPATIFGSHLHVPKNPERTECNLEQARI
jgi:hypothetical protein